MKVISDRRVWLGLFVFLFFIAAFGPSYDRVAQAAAPPQPQVLQSDTNHIVVELDIPNYNSSKQIVGSTTFTVLTVPGFGNTGVVGKPQLPIKGTMVGIPPGAQVTLQILVDKSSSVTLNQPPLPVPSSVVKYDFRQTLPSNAGKSYTPDSATYSANQFYPAQPAVIASVADWRSQRTASVEFHPFQYNPATRQLVFHQQLQVELVLSYPYGLTGQAVGSTVDEGGFDKVFQKGLANYSSAKNWRSNNRASVAPQVAPAFYAGTPWYKIAVSADGIYQVTCGKIAAAAGKSLNIAPSKLQLFKNGQEAAIKVVGTTWGSCSSADTSDYIEFYGQAPTSKYTNTNIYWLTYGKATGKRMAAADNTGTASIPTSFADTIHLEENRLYRAFLPMVEGADHWYWGFVSVAFGAELSTSVSTPNLAPGSLTATLKADVTPFSALGHHTQLFVNGTKVGDAMWSGLAEQKISFDVTGALVPGDNTIRLTEPNDQDPNDVIFVNNFDLTYQRNFSVTSDLLRFNQGGSGIWKYRLTGFTGSSLEAFDVTNPFQVAKFNTLTITPSNSTFTLSFIDSISSPHKYIALTSAQRLSPTSVTPDSASNLHGTTNGADYIIISYGGFISHIMPLANFRATQGLRVKLVDAQDVYDEFADGLPDPQAIHDFLAYAYSNWQAPAPSYALLVGDGHFDPKGYCIASGACPGITTSPNTEFIPPYLLMVDPHQGETDADNRLVAFNTNNPLPDMAIGRLPANSNADVDAMVAKILNYEQNPPAGSWQTAVTFVADQPDPNAGDFWAQSDLVASNPTYLPVPPYTPNRIYYTSPSYPDQTSAHQAVNQAIDDGTLIVNFSGHSFVNYWTNVQLLNTNDVGALTNGNKTPVVLEMTCLTGFFIFPNEPSLAEANVVRAGGGAVASWAASGEGVSTGHYLLDEGFFNAVMQQGVYQIGLAAVLGKNNLWLNGGGLAPDLLDTFQLFGDPATRMIAAQADVSISKTVSSNGPLPLGSPITFQLTFANNGAGRAEKVVISDILPAGIINPSFTSTGVPVTLTGNKPYVWNVGALDPGAGGVITINGTLSPDPNSYASFTLTNTATISTPTQQSDTSNDQSSTVTQAVETLFLPFIIH